MANNEKDGIAAGANIPLMEQKDIFQGIEENPGFKKKEKENNAPCLIKVIGIGGGGNNAINHMYEQKINGVSFVVMNTDRQALNNSPVPNRVLMSKRLPLSSTMKPRWFSSLLEWEVVPVRESLLLWLK